MKSFKGALAAAAAVAAVLVPLYGDPRQTPVTHPEWAHMLLRALDLEAILVRGSGASLAFDSLSWRTTFRLAPDRPFRHAGVEFLPGPPRTVRATPAGFGELGYRVAAAKSGDYRVRLKLGGPIGGPDAPPVAIELTAEGQTKPARSLSFVPAVLIESEGIFLSPGVYTLAVGLPPSLILESLEVVPPCLNSIEPKDGWQPTAIAQTGDVAVTVLKALDLESELPPAATAIEVPSLAFQPTTGLALKASLKGDLQGFWLRADAGGLQAVAHVTLPEPGLYTVYGYGLAGGGQSWLVDACLKSVLCPSAERPESARWHPLLTAEFSAGPHTLAVTLANEAAIQRLKIERKKDSVPDYLGTLRRLGLDLGAQQPVTRSQAALAMSFIKEKRRIALSKCDDILLPSGALVAGLALPGGATVGSGTANPPGPPGGAPVIPLPGPTASPVVAASPDTPASPSPTPTSSPSPAPTPSPTPSPSIGPPPTTLVQPPASPVK